MEIIGKIIGVILAGIICNIFADILVKTPGYFIYTVLFTKAEFDPDHKHGVDFDGARVIITGIVFWLSIIGLAYGVYSLTK